MFFEKLEYQQHCVDNIICVLQQSDFFGNSMGFAAAFDKLNETTNIPPPPP